MEHNTKLRGWRVLAMICVLMTGLTLGTFVVVQGGGDMLVHLPIVARPKASTGGGTLHNGGTVQGPDGVGIGALTDTLDVPITVAISRTAPPAQALPPGAQAASPFYVIGAQEKVTVDAARPFVLAFPVGSVTDTQHLALAALGSGDTVNDADSSLQAWTLLEGQVDAQQGLFLATTAGLDSPGRTFALVTHPDADSPPTPGAASLSEGSAPSTPNFDLFNAKCMYFVDPTHCTPVIESAVEVFLADVYARIQQDLGFLNPRLRFLDETLNYNPNSLSSLGYTMYIEPHYYGFCASEPAAGYYDPHEGILVLCLNPAVGLDSDAYHTLVHEYFHAVEFAYMQTLEDWRRGTEEDWIIEGMAMSAEESYASDEMIRSEAGGWLELHKVDRAMNSEANLDAYFAQDFWVFYGQQHGLGLDYVQEVLAEGATTEDVVNTLGNTQFLEDYWAWAKNQVMEKQINFDNKLQNPCNLEGQVVQQVEVFPHTWPTYLYHDVTVNPLTTMVVQIDFSHSYEAGFGWVFATDPAQDPDATMALGYKFYKDGEGGCEGRPDGERMFEEAEGGINNGATYYVIISNTDYDDAYDYTITFELPIPD